MEENKNKTVGVKVITTMTRTLYIDVPENTPEEEILNIASKEIVSPHNAITIADNALRRIGVKLDKLNLSDWDVISYETTIIE